MYVYVCRYLYMHMGIYIFVYMLCQYTIKKETARKSLLSNVILIFVSRKETIGYYFYYFC